METLVRCGIYRRAYNCLRNAERPERQQVILPKLSSRLKRLYACGTLQTEGDAEVSLLAKIERLRKEVPGGGDEYSAPDGNGGFVGLVLGSEPADHSPKHLHIEIVSCDCYSEPQKPNCSLEQMQAIIDQFNGLMIETEFSSVFWTPIRDLPAIGLILGCKVESELESMTIKQSSAIFTVTRGPIDQIYWTRLSKRPDLLNISLTVRKTTVFDRDYLTSVEQLMNKAFDFLVLEKHLNAARS